MSLVYHVCSKRSWVTISSIDRWREQRNQALNDLMRDTLKIFIRETQSQAYVDGTDGTSISHKLFIIQDLDDAENRCSHATINIITQHVERMLLRKVIGPSY